MERLQKAPVIDRESIQNLTDEQRAGLKRYFDGPLGRPKGQRRGGIKGYSTKERSAALEEKRQREETARSRKNFVGRKTELLTGIADPRRLQSFLGARTKEANKNAANKRVDAVNQVFQEYLDDPASVGQEHHRAGPGGGTRTTRTEKQDGDTWDAFISGNLHEARAERTQKEHTRHLSQAKENLVRWKGMENPAIVRDVSGNILESRHAKLLGKDAAGQNIYGGEGALEKLKASMSPADLRSETLTPKGRKELSPTRHHIKTQDGKSMRLSDVAFDRKGRAFDIASDDIQLDVSGNLSSNKDYMYNADEIVEDELKKQSKLGKAVPTGVFQDPDLMRQKRASDADPEALPKDIRSQLKEFGKGAALEAAASLPIFAGARLGWKAGKPISRWVGKNVLIKPRRAFYRSKGKAAPGLPKWKRKTREGIAGDTGVWLTGLLGLGAGAAVSGSIAPDSKVVGAAQVVADPGTRHPSKAGILPKINFEKDLSDEDVDFVSEVWTTCGGKLQKAPC